MGQDPEELRAQIAQTRQELGQDLDQLAEKVSPAKVVERRIDATKEKVLGVKDMVMGSASEVSGTTSASLSSAGQSMADGVSSAPAQAKRRAAGNPLAAGVIAFGVGWLASALIPATKAEQQGAVKLKEAAEPLKQGLTQAATEVKDNLAPAVADAAASVKGTATEAADTVKQHATEASGNVAEHATGSAGTVADTAKDAAQDAKSSATSNGASTATHTTVPGPVHPEPTISPAVRSLTEPSVTYEVPPEPAGPAIRSGHPGLDERLDL